MKKILGIMAFLLVGTMAMAQTTAVQTSTKETVAKKCCKPSKACAKAMGISLEECKKICGSSSAAATETSTNAEAKLTGLTNASPKTVAKKCCANAKKCCPKSKTTDAKAAASNGTVKLVSNLEGEKKACAKKCTKKASCTKSKAAMN